MIFDHSGNRKYLTRAERQAFLDAAELESPEVQSFCWTLAQTGARVSEVRGLRPQSVDANAQTIAIRCLKKRNKNVYRLVPASTTLLRLLEATHSLSKRRADDTLKHELLWPWSRTTAWTKVKRVMQGAGLVGLLAMPKSLRHAFGVEGVAMSGVPLNMMQKWMGHARIETTAIYANAIGNEERVLANKMWR